MYTINDLSGSVRSQINAAELPMKTIGWEFSDLDQTPALEKVKKWVAMVMDRKVIQAHGEPTCGLGLMLVGEPGHGKTTLASVAIQELLRGMPRVSWGIEGSFPKRPAVFMDYPKLLRLQVSQMSSFDESTDSLIKGIFGEAGRIHNTQVFILDDLGKEHLTTTGWAENTLDALLRARFNAGLPTIVTTNIPLNKWGSRYGAAMGSFASEAFLPIEVKSIKGDLRK